MPFARVTQPKANRLGSRTLSPTYGPNLMPVSLNLVRSSTVGVLVAVAACKGATDPGNGGSQPAVRNQLPRALSSAEVQVASAANAFSFALFRQVSGAQPDSNVFLSPLSASFSLGMALNGARTGTFDAMRTALQLGEATQSDINTGYHGLLDVLDSLDQSVAFTIANSIWYRNTFTFDPTFLDAGRNYFDATIAGLDFTNTTGSLATINGWVNDKTAGKIPTILDEITADQVMFLINAIYFKGSWRSRFDPNLTATAAFTASTGVVQQAQMMQVDDTLSYATVNGAEAIDLPYGDKAFSMTVVLPPEGQTLDAFASSLTESAWQSMVGALQPRKAPFFFPKLQLSYERLMTPDLTALGMGVAFSDVADFSGMSSATGLSIAFVKQKTFIDIDEEGTEAAAVTATGIQATDAPVALRVDRPYLFVIRDRLTGTILFIGKVNRMP